MEFLQELLSVSVQAIAPIIAAGLVALIVKYFKKLGIEVSVAQQEKFTQVAIAAIFKAEEWAAARIKAGIHTTSGQKLEVAIDSITSKFPKITRDVAADLIHENLAKNGLGAVSFLDQAQRNQNQVPLPQPPTPPVPVNQPYQFNGYPQPVFIPYQLPMGPVSHPSQTQLSQQT